MMNPDVLILIADQFAEVTVIACLTALRERGLRVLLVGVTPGLVRGCQGVMVQPDATLGQLAQYAQIQSRLFILSGGARCAVHLLTDPRVHRLIEVVWQAGGGVAALHGAEQIAVQMELDRREGCFWMQGGEETAVFAERLTRAVNSTNA
jgi:putative intracellular protease/amidase